MGVGVRDDAFTPPIRRFATAGVHELTRVLTLKRLSLAQLALTVCVPAAVAVFTDPSALEPLAQLRLEETCRGPALSFPMGKPTVYSIALATSPRTA